MHYKEFPKIEIPDFLQDWRDLSWHNDVNPMSVLYLTSDEEQDYIVCWVAELNRADREYPDTPRFAVQVVGGPDDFGTGQGYVCHSDSEDEVRAVIARAVEAFESGGRQGLERFAKESH
jgi:hypothetical protein